jgi:predicted dithiol-disulfide oxidoreductase (DUF899 family)
MEDLRAPRSSHWSPTGASFHHERQAVELRRQKTGERQNSRYELLHLARLGHAAKLRRSRLSGVVPKPRSGVFGVDEWHGSNALLCVGDRIFRTYIVRDRGDEHMGSTWSYLYISALGR